MAMAAATAMTSCNDKKPSNSMELACDDSFRNIIEQEIEVFEYRYPNNHVLCRYTTQKEALDSLMAGKVKAIVIGRDLTQAEKDKLKSMKMTPRSQKIAVDAIALIVNKENPVEKLSMREIGNILSGETQRWIDVQPDAPDRRINIILDSPGSSLAYYMQDSLLNGRKFGPNVSTVGSVAKVFEAVKKDPANIGIIGVTWLTSDLNESAIAAGELSENLKNDTTAVDGVAINNRLEQSGVKTIGVMRDEFVAYRPYQEYIYDGRYPLTRPIYMIVGSIGGVTGRFYTFVGGVDGQRLIMRTGILPARVPIDIVEIGRE